MKKALYFILFCGLSLLLLGACSGGGKDTPSSTKAVLATAVQGSTDRTLDVPNEEVNVEVSVKVISGAVTEPMMVYLKADASLVETYNRTHLGANAEMLTSYTLPEQVILAKGGRQSTASDLKIVNQGLTANKLYVLPVAIEKATGSSNWELADESVSYITVKYVPRDEDGTPENPYLIKDVSDMLKMKGKMKAGVKVYFKMVADVDMAEQEWEPLNWESPYTKGIDFDGGGHTISNFFCDYAEYPSFIGVLNGYCHDVTFVNAKVKCTSNVRAGILGGYCGLQDGSIRGDVARVHIQGELDHTTSTKYGAGGFFGFFATGGMYACSADVVIKSKQNNAGGLFGYCGKTAEVVDCWTAGTIMGNQRVGGIGGGTVGDDDPNVPIKIVNCYSTAAIHASFGIGGIGGYFTKATATPESVDPGNIIENCIAWNSEIRANWNLKDDIPGEPVAGDKSHYSCGAVVGYTAVRNNLKGCLRNPAMKYNENIFWDYTDAFSLYDQEDVSPANPLVVVPVADAAYNYPYHGKAAAASKTVSQLAQELGWDAKIWDFNTELPTWRADAPVGPDPDVTANGQLPGFGDNDIK